MFPSLIKAALRPVAILSGGLLACSALLGTAGPATAQTPDAHWGTYEWSGGQEKAAIRAFWLFDRTGDPTMNAIIGYVAGAWNGARAANPELPYIGVYRDDANKGKCFVNRTPGYSVASACMMSSLSTFGIKGIAATEGSPHIVGGAFAISDGLSFEDAFTAVCHNFGHLMGLPDSDDDESCMSHDVPDGEAKWYGSGDADAILDLYAHGDGAPVATADTYSTNEDVVLTVAAPGVLTNDTDAVGAVKVTDPAHGSVALNANGSFVYTPAADYNGSDSFTYKASGSGTGSNVVTATITVNAVADVPVAVVDTYSSGEDTVLTVAAPGVLANDTDSDGALTAAKVTDPTHGTLTLNANGSFVYTPTANFNGTDSFTYKANDGSADSNVVAVTITVTATNDAPVAVADTYSTRQLVPLVTAAPGLLGNDTDVEAGSLTATKVSDPDHGTVIVGSDGSFTYTPAVDYTGPDSFSYKANDGTSDSNVATVTVTVEPAVATPAARR